jgi:hypothetical protein
MRPKGKNRPKRKSLMASMKSIRISAPVAMSRVLRGAKSNDNHTAGPTVELLTSLVIPGSAASGTVLCVFNICPQWSFGSRLRVFSLLYAQYRFKRFWLEAIPAAPTTQAGSVCYSIDKDIENNLNLPQNNELSYAMALHKSKVVPIWEATRVDADCSPKTSRLVKYLTQSEAEISQGVQFRVVVVVASPFGAGATNVLLRIGYEIDFDSPILDFGSTAVLPFQAVADGTNTYSINTSGILGFSSLTVPLNNGLVCAVNPVITAGMNAGGSCVGAVIINVKTDNTNPQLLAFPNVQSCLGSLASNINSGSILGPGTNIILNSPISFFPVAFVALGKHT